MENAARSIERMERRQFWEGHVDHWKTSGLTQAEYCRQNDLRVHSFWYWRKRFCPKNTSATLVELPIRGALSGPFLNLPASLCLVINGLCRIEVTKGFDPETLKQLIETLDRL